MRNHKVHDSNPFKEEECQVSVEVLKEISELSKTALRIYTYISEYAYKNDGVVYIDKHELKFELDFKGNKSIYNGLSELLNRDILAADSEKDKFYYNPKFVSLL